MDLDYVGEIDPATLARVRAGEEGEGKLPPPHRVMRPGCDSWFGCRPCRPRREFGWAIHLARKAAEALQAGRSLWVIVAERGKVKSCQRAVAALVKAGEADYVRVDVVGGWLYYLVACRRKPYQHAEQVPGEPLDALCSAAAEALRWLRAIPNERPEGKKRHNPIARSERWAMPRDERCGQWKRDQTLDCRELQTAMRVFRLHGVPTRGAVENVGSLAFQVGYGSHRRPIVIERVRAALRCARDEEGENGTTPRGRACG